MSASFGHRFEYACKPAPRPRVYRRHVVRDEPYQGWKDRVAMDWREAHGERCLVFARYSIRIWIWGPMRGDLDNYAKAVLDALVGYAIPDDAVRYVRELHVTYEGEGQAFEVHVTGVPRRPGSVPKNG